MGAQKNDLLYAERIGIPGTILVGEIVDLANAIKQVQVNLLQSTGLQTFNIIDTSVNVNSFINIRLAPTSDLDENEAELLNIDFSTKSNNGSFELNIFAKDNDLFSGIIKLLYTIN